MNHRRRHMLLGCAGAAAALGLPALAARGDEAQRAADHVDVHLELRAVADQIAIRPGEPTRVWRYRAKLLRGASSALDVPADTYLGPIVRVQRGQRIRIDLINELPEPTVIHWHGLHVPHDMDGHPRFAVAPGQRYVYEFTVSNRAGTYWFHPHPHGRTGAQVYAGLAGLFLVGDEEEAALGLPGGAQDVPLIIQDRNFDTDNQFVYPGGGAGAMPRRRGGMMGEGMMGGGMGSMMAGMMGVLGDRILVNGSVQPGREVERRAYRLRLLNASNTRTLKLAWDDGTPLTVIGSDGGLLAAPLRRAYVMLAPAERVELWVDFGGWPPGAEPTLRSLAFDSGVNMGGMMGGMMGGNGSLADGAAFDVHRFKVGSGDAKGESLPQRLTSIDAPQPRVAVNRDRPKVFEPTMGMMAWGINGRGFDMLGASELETVKLGTHEIWEFRNEGRGSMMAMPHSMHVHGLQFRIIGRSVSNRFSAAYDTVRAGFVDEGWKDTVLVMPGERVRILLGFADHPGLFLYHCHMLEHEDTGLMRNYLVEA